MTATVLPRFEGWPGSTRRSQLTEPRKVNECVQVIDALYNVVAQLQLRQPCKRLQIRDLQHACTQAHPNDRVSAADF